jgi:hypothetical protein
MNGGVAYQMVWPQHVIEISVLDLVTENTRGAAVTSMVLDFSIQNHLAGMGEQPSDPVLWHIVRRMPLCAMISPQFVRVREDKGLNSQDLRLEQVTSLVEVQQAGVDSRTHSLPKSELVRREVYLKVLKGQEMVRKLLMIQTNKPQPDFPAYVVIVTDFSPVRKTPLERDIRTSNSRDGIENEWKGLVGEYIVKGWVQA